jgi:hypothetical protein
MTSAMQVKLAGIETGAEVNDTASEILTKVLTVDGTGSGLDADLLDGNHASAFAAAIHTHVIGDVTGLQTALDGKAATVHTHVIGDVTGLQTALDGKAATVHTHAIGDVTGLQTALDGKVDENAAITGATKTKITYDAKGLVTAGADATTADIADSSNRRYVTDAQQTVIGNTSGTNTGDQTITLTGDVTGSGTGSFAATIANDAVTNAKLANMATATIKGRTTAGSGDPEDLTGTQATTLLDTFTSSLKGLAPASGGGTSNFLRADGTWAAPSGGGGGGVSDGDKGDITVSSSGTVWTVDTQAITYAKIQNVSNTNRLLGRSTAGAGVIEEITVGGDLTQTGSSFTIANDAVTFAKMQNSAAAGLSVIGRSTNSAGDFAEINAGTDGHVLRRAGTAVGFGTLASGAFANNTVSRAALANATALSVIGRSANSSGAPADIAAANDGEVLRRSGTTLGFGTIATAGIADNAVTYAKIQDVTANSVLARAAATDGDASAVTLAASQLLGRGATGDVAAITIGSGLSMTGTTLSASGGGGGGAGTVLSPTQLTAWQNDYSPSGWANTVQTLRIDSNGSFNGITGLAATSSGHRVKIINVGSFAFLLYDEGTASTAANRFSNGQDIFVLPGRTIELEYDNTSSRWRLASGYNILTEDPAYVRMVQLQFIQSNSGISSVANGFPLYWTGTGNRAIQSVATSGFGGRWGVLAMTIDNGTRSGIYSDNNSWIMHNGTIALPTIYQTSVRFEDLSDGTNRYIARCGFLDSDSGTPIDGLFLEYTDNVNSGQWTFNAYNNSSVTTVNSTTAVAADTWYAIKIVSYPNDTARAYVNGVLVATITSGLPGSQRDFAWYSGFRKTVGTTTRTMYIDYGSAAMISPSIV